MELSGLKWCFALFIFAPLWGAIAGQLFAQQWLAFINAISSFIGLVRRRGSSKMNISGFVFSVIFMFLWYALLRVGEYVSEYFSLGYTKGETYVFYIFFVISIWTVLMELIGKAKLVWERANAK